MSLLTQLRLLLWKNFTLRRRQKVRLVVELIWPLFLFFILVSVRSTNQPVYKSQCHYPNKPLPSAGVLPWLQGMLCNIQNPCVSYPTPGEAPGQVNNFNDSTVTKVLIEVQSLLADPALFGNVQLISDDIGQWVSVLQNANPAGGQSIPLRNLLRTNETFSEYLTNSLSVPSTTATSLMRVKVRLGQLPALSGEGDLRSVLCSESINRIMEFNSSNQKAEFQNITCSLTANQLLQARQAFMQNVDNMKLLNALPLALGLNQRETGVLMAKTSVNIAPLMTAMSNFGSSALLSAVGTLDFRSDPFGSLSQLMCGTDVNTTSKTTSRDVVRTVSTESDQQNTRAATADNTNTTSTNTSEFCKNLTDTLESSSSLRLLWKTFRPFLQGKILYTPDTNVTRSIVTEANRTFDAVAKVGELAEAWLQNKDLIWNFFNSSTQINTLRGLLKNPVLAVVLDQRLEDTSLSTALISNFLFNGPESKRPAGMPAFDWRNIFIAVSQIAQQLTQILRCFDLDKFEGVSSETVLVEQSFKLLNQDRFWAGLVFTGLYDSSDLQPPPHIRYKIRMEIEETERTDKIKERSWSPTARDNPFNSLRYVRGGFVYLQDMVDRGITKVQTGVSQPLGVFAQQMPYPCYMDDVFLRSLTSSLPLYMTLAWIFSVALIVKGVVQEKEARLKETVMMMGLKSSTYWLSWAISSTLPLAVSAALLTVILKYGKILRYSDPSVIFVFLLVFCVATVMQCFFISVFFSRANLAAACGGLIYFLLYLPHVLCYAWRDILGFGAKIATSLLSCVAFGYGCENFARYEEQGIGIQWSNIRVSPQENDRYSFIVSIFMMLFDALIYWIMTWYIENVFPGQYGIPKPWYFPFTSSYWCGTLVGSDGEPDLLNEIEDKNGYLEKSPSGMKAGVCIRNLVKVYKTGNKLAVDGLSLDFYQDHITSFLGHNGAGKTTTMSILTGLFAPTSGTAYINGNDIRTDMDTIRTHLGMCPQHNVLFNDMTVEEHIYFYARLKGRSSKEVKKEIDQMINDVGLPHKRKDLAKNLSGGMQRKLSVAIAFVGGSNVVILDEPTAGVDPYARRGIWELLLKYKKGRTIILSTHHMDEADILGDRIAIISHGRVCCCGSSLFLKKKYGRGYYLTLARANQDQVTTQRFPSIKECDKFSVDEGICSDSISSLDPPDVADLSRLVRRHVPEAEFLEVVGQELVYVLPYAGARDGSFASLFKELDMEKSTLGVTSYGISDTSLEEIFLKVAKDTGVDVESNDKKGNFEQKPRSSSRISGIQTISSVLESKDENTEKNEVKVKHTSRVEDIQRPMCANGKGSYVIMGWSLIKQQFFALFIKRFHHARRSRRGLIAQVVMPAFFVCLALIFSLIVPPFVEYPNLELQPWMYGAPQNTFYSFDGPGVDQVEKVTKALLSSPGFGTRCMSSNPIPKLPCNPAGGTDWFTPAVDPSISEIFEKGNWSLENPSPECQCSTPQRSIMLPDCPLGAGGLPPPQRTQNTTDTLQNVTARNMTDFLLKNYQKSGKIRYGGISVGGVNSQVNLNESDITAVISNLKSFFNISQNNQTEHIFQAIRLVLLEMGTRDNVKVWFYNQGWHSLVSFLNVASNGILRGNLPAGRRANEYGITTFNHPLNLTKEQLSAASLATTSTDVVVSICVIFAMSFIPASFVLFLIQERVSKSKHLQFVSGVNPTIYWLANFAWDMCNYVVPCIIVIIIFLCFQQKSYVSPPNLPALILLLFLYGWSITPMMYPASFLFSVPSTAYVVLTCINLFIGINGSVATFVMELFDDPNITRINDIVKQALLVFPHFCLGRGLMDMAKNQAMANLYKNLGEDRFENPLNWNLVGKNLFAMSIQGAVMFGLTLLIQYKFFCKPRSIKSLPTSSGGEDEDVTRERERVHQGGAQNDLLQICDLTKMYRVKLTPAVDKICVGVPAAECFGLLGINGAGKTTTFKMLTGDISPTAGDAFVNGYSIRSEMQLVQQNMGYCPQFDAIDDLLTGREHLEFYARLRGVPEKEVSMVAEWGVQKLGLVKYSGKSAGTYSGGNKRKLSTAMALIGCPPLVFLDEPTTGMDPKARRFLWDCILSVIKEGRSVILTSHSMEECEALCTRMAIMVNGQFKCLGSIQHLKSRFGEGYTLIVRVCADQPDMCVVESFVRDTFPGSTLKEKHHNTLQYQIPQGEGTLAHIFSQLTKHQQMLRVEDYSVSQTTLDQVFVNFARQQRDAEDGVFENVVDLSDEIQISAT
ncbi:phospholipid-transporting ATPase ABCA1 isoform X2 [Rhinichthys klamathensis goyatoka]|uniref:phospholipid-transporting ATPase ABCA1 isoform X2 n=1 Tax=Rhinichthys klamathensis goyatoka TaxID=3034132 RepID=UPI0024B59DB7|nr:phospholipid-transporting ATPase ABCA1 isoform X2 [Rhinichthys klamathensis goyatoka]